MIELPNCTSAISVAGLELIASRQRGHNGRLTATDPFLTRTSAIRAADLELIATQQRELNDAATLRFVTGKSLIGCLAFPGIFTRIAND